MDAGSRRRWVPPLKTDEEQRTIRRRRAEASWYAWFLEEFARYAFGLGVFAALVFAPLQMEASWLPRGLPPRLAPGIVATVAVLVDGALVFLGWRLYLFLWGSGGWVPRAVADREGGLPTSEDDREGH